MPFTCDGAGSVWPDIAWRLALLAPNLAPGDIVNRVNVRTAAANFDAGSRSSTPKELQLWKLQNDPGGAGGRAMTCSPASSVHGGDQGVWWEMNAAAAVAEKVAPTVQASPEGSADSPVTAVLGSDPVGPGITDQAVPFQCRVRATGTGTPAMVC